MVAQEIVVTGAAGFIGSYVCKEVLRSDNNVKVLAIDNLATGSPTNIRALRRYARFNFRKLDLVESSIPNGLLKGAEVVIHLAANPEVRLGSSDTSIDFKTNITATRNLLETLKNNAFQGRIIFTSTSAVYGEPSIIPTPETYGPLLPISLYAASKLACEALISAYAGLFGFRATVLRFANVVGGRSNHGVVYDFVHKLLRDATRLEVLGDGTQTKSYMHISDCVSAIMHVMSLESHIDLFNAGTKEATNVMRIAEIVRQEMNMEDAKITTRAVTRDGRAWAGDVKNMLLDCSKIINSGWHYVHSSDDAIRQSVREILPNPIDGREPNRTR